MTHEVGLDSERPQWRTQVAAGERLIHHLVASPKARRHVTLAPADGKPLFEIPCSTQDDVDLAFLSARRAQRVWGRTSFAERRRIVMRFHDLLLQHRDEGLDICQWETGKARKDALEELLEVCFAARYYGRTFAKHVSPRRVASPVPGMISTKVLQHPVGVVGILATWNYPLALAVSDAIPALLAGNAVVLKPDWQTTVSALWAVELLYQAGLPAGVFRVVAGDGQEVGPWVVDRSDYVMFTGSSRIGREIAVATGRRLVGCSLELGGKNAMIIRADANVERAADIAARSCFSNAGQLCISMERIFVHADIHDAFLAAFVRRAEALVISAQPGWGSDMGSLISEQQLERVDAHVREALGQGARLATGGRRRPDIGPFVYEPTILTGVTEDMEICHEETFGPVVSVWSFTADEDAVAAANASPYGLNASVISRDRKVATAMAARLRAGTVNVNEGYGTAAGTMSAPWGGLGDSGLGRKHGVEGLLKYTESQSVAVQRFGHLGPWFGQGHERWGEALVSLTKIAKNIGMR
jgi:succinate-semialdehyde dehydrogenase / glutarate-semialdehyde dehydrogenase